MIGITRHAWDRITRRLRGVVTVAEIAEVLEGQEVELGETHFLVKRLPQGVMIRDGDQVLEGDEIWAVVKRKPSDDGNLVTVMVRQHWQPSRGDHPRKR